jgi:hypothetical protein
MVEPVYSGYIAIVATLARGRVLGNAFESADPQQDPTARTFIIHALLFMMFLKIEKNKCGLLYDH